MKTKVQVRDRLAHDYCKHWGDKPLSHTETFYLTSAFCEGFDASDKLAQQEVDALNDEIKCLNFNLEQKSKEIGRSEHRGNTVDYIYDKLNNYSKQLGEAAKEITALKAEVKDYREALLVIKECSEKVSGKDLFIFLRIAGREVAKQAVRYIDEILAKHKKEGEA